MLATVAVGLVAAGAGLAGLAAARTLGVGERITVGGLVQPIPERRRPAVRLGSAREYREVAAGAVIGLAVGRVVLGSDLVQLSVCALGGALALPKVYRAIVTDRATATLRRQMPEALATLSSALRSGRNLGQAVEEAAVRTPRPLGDLMREVWKRLNQGEDAEDAFRWLHERARLDETASMAAVVATQKKTGGDMAGSFDTIAEQSRTREAARAEARAEMSEQTFLLYMFSVYPAFLFLKLRSSDPTYFAAAMDTVLGKLDLLAMIIGLPAVGLVAGVWWAKGGMR